MSGLQWSSATSAEAEDIIDSLALEMRDIAAQIYENSQKSLDLLVRMERAIETLAPPQFADAEESIEAFTTLLKVVTMFVSETKTEAEDLDDKAYRMERLRDSVRFLKVSSPLLAACNCGHNRSSGNHIH